MIKSAAAIIVAVSTPVILAAPANAKDLDKHVAVNCPAPFSQDCPGAAVFKVDMAKDTISATVSFTADSNPPACAPASITMFGDGQPLGPAQVIWPGQTTESQVRPINYPGTHTFAVTAKGVLGGCNTGSMSGWSGTIHVETLQDEGSNQ
jgi:hypothetical protein